jgi:hypothetical protein
VLFSLKISQTHHVRAMTCTHCGPSNHTLQQRYRVFPIWLFVGFPFQLHYVWECQVCQRTQPCDAATFKRLAPEFDKPFWHITPGRLLKLVAAVALAIVAALMLFFALKPSRLERLEPKLASLATGQVLVVEWTQIAPAATIDRASEFDGSEQFGRAKIVAIDAENITLQTPPWIFENAFRAIVHTKDEYTSSDPKQANKNAFRNLRADQTVQIKRARLRELLVSDGLMLIE